MRPETGRRRADGMATQGAVEMRDDGHTDTERDQRDHADAGGNAIGAEGVRDCAKAGAGTMQGDKGTRRTSGGMRRASRCASVMVACALAAATASVTSMAAGAAGDGASAAPTVTASASGDAHDGESGSEAQGGSDAGVTIAAGGGCSQGDGASGCDGEPDGTHGYEGLSAEQAALLDGVGTDVVLQGIGQGRTFVALFGYASCPDCKAAVPLLLDEALGHGIWQVLYVDTRADPSWDSNTDIDGYDRLVGVMGDRFSKDDDGTPHMQVPFVAFVRDGRVVASVEGDGGLSRADAQHAEQARDELAGRYAAGFDAMLGTDGK